PGPRLPWPAVRLRACSYCSLGMSGQALSIVRVRGAVGAEPQATTQIAMLYSGRADRGTSPLPGEVDAGLALAVLLIRCGGQPGPGLDVSTGFPYTPFSQDLPATAGFGREPLASWPFLPGASARSRLVNCQALPTRSNRSARFL